MALASAPTLTPRILCQPEGIPIELRQQDHWLTWKFIPDPKRPAKPKKMPFCAWRDAVAGRPLPAKSNDPTTWASFEQAVEAWRRHRHSGIGYVLGPDEVGIDFDGCRDPETGVIAPWAQTWIDRLDSYTEVSPSGEGCKTIVKASLSAAVKESLGGAHVGIEIYQTGRYFTMTGAHVPGTPKGLRSAQAALDALVAHLRPTPPPPTAAPALPSPSAPIPVVVPDTLLAEGWRVVRARAVELRLREWVERKLEQATERMRTAPAGQLHNLRVREARLLGGVIAAAPGYLSAQQAVDALFRARLPEGHSATEHKALIDGLELGLRSPIPPDDGPTFPTDEEPRVDAQGVACCPACDTPIRRSQYDYPGAGPGWFCPRCKGAMIWPADAARTPTRTAAASGDDMAGPAHGPTNRTDLGNAARLVRDHGAVVRYVYKWSAWLTWDGTRWLRDETGDVERLARETVRNIYHEAGDADTEAERKAVAKWAAASESRGRLEAMVALARAEPGIPVRHTDLDADPWLLNCPNGTLDLRTGELRPHRRADLQTKRAAVAYDPQAACPTWDAFLQRIFAGDVELIRFVQQAAGYTLTGLTIEQCLFFCYGKGRNGKSTLINTLMKLLVDYAQKAPTEMLMAKPNGGGSGVPNDIARLVGTRMVVAAEVEENRRLSEAVVKDLTGNDPISARYLHQEFFDFLPSHKLWMYGNHKPVIRGTDDGIWRRLRIIPFLVQIPEEEKDETLPDRLLAELPGILAWAVRGCLDWQASGLKPPAAVVAATTGYRNEMDVIGAFLDEAAVLAPTASAAAGDLYAAYTAWCDEGGEHAINQRRFGAQLTERGLERYKSNGVWRYRGIGLLSDRSESDAPDAPPTKRLLSRKPTAAELMQARLKATNVTRIEEPSEES